MNGVALMLAVAAVGIDYGWHEQDGKLEYIIQIEPDLVRSLMEGEEIVSEIHPDVRGVRRFRIKVGRDAVPRSPLAVANVSSGASGSVLSATTRVVNPGSLRPGDPGYNPQYQANPYPANQYPGQNQNAPSQYPPGGYGAGQSASRSNDGFTPRTPNYPTGSGSVLDGRAIPVPSISTPAGTGNQPNSGGGYWPGSGSRGTGSTMLTPGGPTMLQRTPEYAAVKPEVTTRLVSAESNVGGGKTGNTGLGDGKTNGTTTGTDDEQPWGLLVFTALALFASIGINFFQGWTFWGLNQRYRELVAQRRRGRNRRSSRDSRRDARDEDDDWSESD